MRIAIIGAGRMGQMLGRLFTQAGHTVVLSNSRGADSLADVVAELGERASAAAVADAVGGANVVVLATTWGTTEDAVSSVTDWTGRIVIDTTNNRSRPGPDGLIDIGERTSSEVVADLIPGARVVKAFNHTGIPLMAEALGAEPAAENAIPLSGDDPEAKAVVTELVSSVGGVAIDAGSLAKGGWMHGATGPLSGRPMLSPAETRAILAETGAGV